jgi:class 3 adenylate cyclase
MDRDAKILIVANDEQTVNILRALLRSQGYNAILVSSDEEALRLVHVESPDLIILDVAPAGKDEVAICRWLKAEEQTWRIPIIVVTTLDQAEARVQSIEAGAADFLIKPIQRRELWARVSTAIAVKKAIDRKVSALLRIKNHLAKFVPVAVRRALEENPEVPRLEKREEDLSVLFVDVSGYTNLSQRIAPAQITTLIERYFSHFLDCIQEEGGDITEMAGDGIMALFRSSDGQEHARKAARAALKILEVTRRLNREHPDAGTPVAVHMGLNSGRASVGSTRLEGALGSRWTFTASGPVTNLAARLADAAPPGSTLIGPETARRIGSRFSLEHIEIGALKNLAEKVEAYRLAAEKVGDGSTAVTPSPGQSGSSPVTLKFADAHVECSGMRDAASTASWAVWHLG